MGFDGGMAGRAIGRRFRWSAVVVVATLLAAACGTGSGEDASVGATTTTPTTTSPSTASSAGQPLQATVRDGGDDTDNDTDTSDTSDGGDAGDEGDDTTEATAPPDGFCGGLAPVAIRFAAGAVDDTIAVSASAGQTDHYSLDVRAGQILSITLASADAGATARLADPGSAEGSNRFRELVVAPTMAGTYRICVDAGDDGADYELTVGAIDDTTPTRIDAPWCGDAVNDRGSIRFAAGAVRGTAADGLVRGERDLYTFDASTEQFVEILLLSLEDNAVFSLQTPSGATMTADDVDLRDILPEDGTYAICIGSIRGNASYELSLSIT